MNELSHKPNVNLSQAEWQTLASLSSVLVPKLPATDAAKQDIEHSLGQLSPMLQFKFRLMLKVLSTYGVSTPFTFSPRLFKDLSFKDREQTIYQWSQSRILPLRMFVGGALSFSLLAFYKQSPGYLELVDEHTIHPHLQLMRKDLHVWTIPKVKIPKQISDQKLGMPSLTADVAIVGSGCSAMVAAYKLTKAGYKVILIEKGYHVNALTSPAVDHARDSQAFDREGVFTTENGTVMVLAGATVGGGGAVNWSCSLHTPEAIRKEWTEKGAPLYSSPEYDRAMEAVDEIMQVTHDVGAPHSFTNQLILDSSKKLGYPAAATGQNTGKHTPNSAFLEFGNRSGEKGGIAEWLRYAVDHGALVLQKAVVTHAVHHRKKVDYLSVDLENGKKVAVFAKRYVCAAGSLHTPALLKRSKFRNKNIGKGLKLHPGTVAFGEFNETVNKRLDPIMTAVTTQADNFDGNGHGPKIEAVHHRPHILLNFLPWKGSSDWQSKADSLPNLCSLLVITRDKGAGSVGLDSNGEASIEYTPSEYDLAALKNGCICAANLLYVGGARRIFLSSSRIPDFVTNKPKEGRSIWDADYVEWLGKVHAETFTLYDTKLGSAHQLASCRMDDRGPQHGVVNGKGQMYDASNMYIIDTSVFPSASGVNPMTTCFATSYVLVDYLIKDLAENNYNVLNSKM